jgi:hypothetical protein
VSDPSTSTDGTQLLQEAGAAIAIGLDHEHQATLNADATELDHEHQATLNADATGFVPFAGLASVGTLSIASTCSGVDE